MNTSKPTQYHVIMDINMSGQRRIVRQNGMAADVAVMRNVAISHDPVVVSERRSTATMRRASVDTAVLADDVSVANY